MDREKFTLRRQPDAISCGPTALYMAATAAGGAKGFSIPLLGALMGTDEATGTTDVKMRKGVAGLGLRHDELLPIEDAAAGMARLDQALTAGHCVLVRTILDGGMLHWFMVIGQEAKGYRVMDPARGELVEKPDALARYWGRRGYQGFVVHNEQAPSELVSLHKAKDLTPDLRRSALRLCAITFSFCNGGDVEYTARTLRDAKSSVSVGLVRGDRLVGAYLIKKEPHYDTATYRRWGLWKKTANLDKIRGLHGLAIAVIPDMRGRGYGSLLRAYPRLELAKEADYIMGGALDFLGNLQHWETRRRTLTSEGAATHVSAEVFERGPQHKVAGRKAAAKPELEEPFANRSMFSVLTLDEAGQSADLIREGLFVRLTRAQLEKRIQRPDSGLSLSGLVDAYRAAFLEAISRDVAGIKQETHDDFVGKQDLLCDMGDGIQRKVCSGPVGAIAQVRAVVPYDAEERKRWPAAFVFNGKPRYLPIALEDDGGFTIEPMPVPAAVEYLRGSKSENNAPPGTEMQLGLSLESEGTPV